MKETLILLTGTYRFNNLIHICKTIEDQYNKYIDKFDIRWLICKDKYNGFGDIEKFIAYINNTEINYQIIDTGKPNKPNYGGDLFNVPLFQYVQEQQLKNPWVYVLDDDNILHPILLDIFERCLDNEFYEGKEIITTINKWHVGHNREIDKDIFLKPTENDFIREWFIFDPSAVILRYSVIERHGFFSNEFLYDFYWLNFKVLDKEKENIIWFNDYDHSFGRHIVGSYHNCLVKEKDIERFENIDTLNIDICLYDTNIEAPQLVPMLSNESKEKILNIIREEINRYEE